MGAQKSNALATGSAPAFHHLDRRAPQIIALGDGPDDELINTKTLAHWLGVSTQWLEIGRTRGYGPVFERLSTRMIRYKRGAVREWLQQRAHASTADYRRNPNTGEAR